MNEAIKELIMRNTENITKVAVASCGGEKEQLFINRINKIHVKNAPQFICRGYINTDNPVLVLQLALTSHKEMGLPLILLLSQQFLDNVWRTASKAQILKTILNYSTKQCVHIWSDNLTESDVEKYSVGLCRSDSAFRRISYSELPTSDYELLEMLLSLLNDTTEKISFANYSVQDERPSKPTDFVPSISPSNLVFTEDISSKPNFNKKEPTSLPTPQQSGSNNKKKNRRKKGNHYQQALALLDHEILLPKSRLQDICLEDRSRLTSMLDVGYGANWKQIAAYYEFTPTEIGNIELSKFRDVGPSEMLFQILETRYPDLDLTDLQDKCRQISRNDVAQAIGNILSKLNN